MNNLNGNNSKPVSTIPKIPSSIIFTGKALQLIAPPLATKFAVKLFKTPIKFKTPEREKIMANSAQKELLFIPELNKKVMVYTYGYSKRKILY